MESYSQIERKKFNLRRGDTPQLVNFFFQVMDSNSQTDRKKMQFEKTQSFLTCKKFLSSYGVQSQILTKKITI